MATPSPTEDERPLLNDMRSMMRQLREALESGKPIGGAAGRPANRFRVLLRRIYGADSPQIESIPIIRWDDPAIDLRAVLTQRLEMGETVVSTLASMLAPFTSGRRVFIGHGRSALWRELKDFLQDRLSLQWDEFNRESVAGIGTSERLQTMLNAASFAFLVMTSEEEHADSTVHARPNVIHEVGLFQGKLGLRKAIVLLEDGCTEFSNISGLGQIRFPRGNISAAYEEIRRVLERERVI